MLFRLITLLSCTAQLSARLRFNNTFQENFMAPREAKPHLFFTLTKIADSEFMGFFYMRPLPPIWINHFRLLLAGSLTVERLVLETKRKVQAITAPCKVFWPDASCSLCLSAAGRSGAFRNVIISSSTFCLTNICAGCRRRHRRRRRSPAPARWGKGPQEKKQQLTTNT